MSRVDDVPETGLSDLETEILKRLAYGGTTKEIARDLGLSAQEVRCHLDLIFNKLAANDPEPGDAA